MDSNKEPDSPIESAVLSCRFHPRSRLVIAASGGLDSMVLCHSAYRLSVTDGREWTLHLCHVNHSIRGRESDDDEMFVRRWAAQHQIELDVVRVDTLLYAKTHGLSVETAARRQRYEALYSTLASRHGDVILTAHTLDDQVETVVLHLLRGSGADGLRGIPSRRGRIVRPFLHLSRSEIETYASEYRIHFRVDSSNNDPAHLRNRIRHTVVPTLQKVTPSASKRIARAANRLAVGVEYLARDVDAALPLLDARYAEHAASANLAVWRALHDALRAAVLRRLLRACAGTLENFEGAHLDSLTRFLDSVGTHGSLRNNLPNGINCACHGNRFLLQQGPLERIGMQLPLQVPIPGTTSSPLGRLDVHILPDVGGLPVEQLGAVRGPLHALCDYDRLGKTLVLRSRRPGDRLQPVGMNGRKKVQDLLVDRKVPEILRDTIAIIENHEGIVWIPGHAVETRVAIASSTVRVVHLLFEPNLSMVAATMQRHFDRQDLGFWP